MPGTVIGWPNWHSVPGVALGIDVALPRLIHFGRNGPLGPDSRRTASLRAPMAGHGWVRRGMEGVSRRMWAGGYYLQITTSHFISPGHGLFCPIIPQ